MKRFNFLKGLVLVFSLTSIGWAEPLPIAGFMSSKDLFSADPRSNISLYNSQNSSVTVYGLYLRQLGSVSSGESCDHATSIYEADTNSTIGALVTPTVINPGQTVAVGGNYLYNMIYGTGYYIQIEHPSSPPGCSLPGCTWGSDEHIYHWCIYLGALAPVARTSDYTSNVPPAVSQASNHSGHFNYNLIGNTHYVTLGPITCNDQTLTCTVSSPQSQTL